MKEDFLDYLDDFSSGTLEKSQFSKFSPHTSMNLA